MLVYFLDLSLGFILGLLFLSVMKLFFFLKVGIYFTYHNICLFKYIDQWFYYIHKGIQTSLLFNSRTFSSLQRKHITINGHFPFPPALQPLATMKYLLSLWICLLWTFHINRIKTICDLLCLFSYIFNIHRVVARINTSFLFNGWMIFHYMGIRHFVNSHFSWWPLDCFHFLAIMSSASVNTHVQIFAWTYVSSSRSRIARSYGDSMFKLLRTYQTVCSKHTILCYHQQCMRDPISWHSHQHLLLSIFFNPS